MATVVIVHAPEDTLPARALAEKIRQAKLDVVLEKTGDEFRDAFKGVPVALALWSPRSVTAQQMSDDVTFAKSKTKVVHALMQNAKAPPPFTTEPSVDLTGWRGEDEFEPWRQLAKEITSKAGVPNLPPPTPRPPSGFFQPGAPPVAPAPQGAPAQQQRPAAQQQQRPAPAPQPQRAAAPPPQRSAPPPRPAPQARQYEATAEPKKGGGMMMIAIITFVIVAALGGGGYWFWNQQQGSQAAATAWENIDPTDASAIRQFIASNPPAAAKATAEQALVELEQQSWDAAQEAGDIATYEAFLRQFPDSTHAIEANGQIQSIRVREQDLANTATSTTTATATTTTATTTQEPAGQAPVQLTPPQQPETQPEQPPQE